MSKGREQHQARAVEVAGLGRSLSRRAKNRCEICEQSRSLKVIEVEPIMSTPDVERAILVCNECEAALSDKGAPHDQMHCLEVAVWSETTPVQIAAIRLLSQLSGRGVGWAQGTMDSLFISPEVEALLG